MYARGIEPGDIIADRYLVERFIARGGMAYVVAATHIGFGDRVAYGQVGQEVNRGAIRKVAGFTRLAHPALSEKQLDYALADVTMASGDFTNANGDVWSGCAVVDEKGTAGYGKGAIMAVATQAPEGRQAQYLWYSTNGGRSFKAGGFAPVMPNPGVHDFRDPKIVWHEPSHKWVMALYLDGDEYAVFNSTNLLDWQETSRLRFPNDGECPDLFELPVDGDKKNTTWVFIAGTGNYMIGDFDGNPQAVTEMDALVAYLQMLGTLVNFSTYDEAAGYR